MRITMHMVTRVRHIVCRAMVLFVWFWGFTKFALTPGGGGAAPISCSEVAISLLASWSIISKSLSPRSRCPPEYINTIEWRARVQGWTPSAICWLQNEATATLGVEMPHCCVQRCDLDHRSLGGIQSGEDIWPTGRAGTACAKLLEYLERPQGRVIHK